MAAKLLPVLIGVGLAGVAIAISRESLASVNWLTEETKPKAKSKSKTVARSLKDAALGLSPEIRASAEKWAKKRGLPVIDVLTTILLESRGNPKAHALSSKEDSRGVMQVNVRAHAATLSKLGYKPDDLYNLDVGIEIGTYILAAYRKKVLDALKANPVKQAHDVSTLTRLRYAGPKYVDNMLAKAKTTTDTVRPFKHAEVYVDHWKQAKQAIADTGKAYA